MARPLRSVLALFSVLTVSLFFLAGCGDPEAKYQEQLTGAGALIDQGEYDQALDALNQLNEQFPNRGAVLEAMGQAYEGAGDLFFAGLFYEQAGASGPEYSRSLFTAARLFAEAGDQEKALSTVNRYLELYPDDAEAWRMSADLLADSRLYQRALSAHLRAERLDGPARNPEYAATMGELYLRAGNLPQAEIHFETALNESPDDRFRALMGLLETNFRENNMPRSEEILLLLDEEFPGAVEASSLAAAQEEVKLWRAKQDALAEQIAALENRPDPEAENTEAEEGETGSGGESVGAGTVLAVTPGGGKMAAVEGAENILDAKLAGLGTVDLPEPEPKPEPEPEPEPLPPPPPPPPPTTYELAVEARDARDFDRAVPLFWKAVQEDPENGDVWAELSSTYLLEGDAENAEIAILEARRRDPSNVSYTLTYLEVIQKSRSQARYMEELEKAYNRTPDNPDIVLAIARAYSDSGVNSTNAAYFYREFLELAPGHPEVTAARRELNALP